MTAYEWHVLYRKAAAHAEVVIDVFDAAEDAADRLFQLWDLGFEDAELIPVLK